MVPTVTLAASAGADITVAQAEVLLQPPDHVRTAPPRAWRNRDSHSVLRNAAIPMVTVISLQAGLLLSVQC